jgi:hypothetical protein
MVLSKKTKKSRPSTLDRAIGGHFVAGLATPHEISDMEQDFWRRFIGRSRKRLAQAINFIFPQGIAWKGDPTPVVNTLFPTGELARLLSDIPTEESLDEVEKEGVTRIEQLLAGMWQGEGPEQNIS